MENLQQKFDILISHFQAPDGYDTKSYLNPMMYFKSRTKKHAIKLVYRMDKKIYSNTLETEDITKAMNMYYILSWHVIQQTNLDAREDDLGFLSTEQKPKSQGW